MQASRTRRSDRSGATLRRGHRGGAVEALEPRQLLASVTPGIAIDTTYGPGGRGYVVTDTATVRVSGDSLAAAALLPDGKLMLVGTNADNFGFSHGTLTRLNADGTRDTTFGPGGTGAVEFPYGTITRIAAAVVLPDGKVLVAANGMKFVNGMGPDYADLVLARLNPDGTPDPAFGAGGTRYDGAAVPAGAGLTVIPGGSRFDSLLVLPDGKLLAGGTAHDAGWPVEHAGLWRFSADGIPDASFGTGGRVDQDQGPSAPRFTLTLALPDGRVYADTNAAPVELSADGAVRGQLPFPAPVVALQGDGKVVGAFFDGLADVVVARWLPDGTPDATFGGGPHGPGTVDVPLGSTVYPDSAVPVFTPAEVLVLPGGRIVVGGTAGASPATETKSDILLLGVNPDGTPDTSFGVGGVQALATGTGDNVFSFNYTDTLVDLVPAAGGRLYAAGVTSMAAPDDTAAGLDNYLVARYALDPGITIDTTVPARPIPEGTPFDVAAAASYAPGGSVVDYAWDTDFRGRSFLPNATGPLPTITVTDDDFKDRVVLRVTTSDGLQALARVPVNVVNAPPTLDLLADEYVPVGRTVVIPGRVADPGAEQITFTIDFGDGTATTTRTFFPSINPTFNFQHAYARGTYTVTVTARDDDGGVATRQASVTATDLAGAVFVDADDSSTREPGEAPVAGAVVFLDLNQNGRADAGEPTSVTDAAGFYHFGGLSPGAYNVGYVQPAGWRITNPTSPSSPGIGVTELQGGQRHFGISDKGRIGGDIFRDADADGVRGTNEPQLPDFAAYLDLDNDGFYESGEPRATIPVIRVAPGYLFTNVSPGTYVVRLCPPPAINAEPPAQTYSGLATETLPRGPGGNEGYVVTVGPAEVVTGKDFGVAFAASSVEGVVFDDADRDGIRGAGEAGLVRRVVYLDADDDGTLDPGERRVISGPGGPYKFGLLPGAYTLRQVLPAGWGQSVPAGGGGYDVTVTGQTSNVQRSFGTYRLPAEVAGRYVFYNRSAFDGSDDAADAADDAAIATGKAALLPGQAASFANVTSYSRGINGVMFDLAGRATATDPGVDDFEFEVESIDGAAPRMVAPTPRSVTVRRGAGSGGSDRVTLIWGDDAVRNAWLRVTVKANADTGLAADDVFSFGNLIGETGDGAGTTLRVNALDLGAVKRALNGTSGIEGQYDFNRDGRVNALDLGAVKANLNRSLAPAVAPAVVMPAPESAASTRDLESAIELLLSTGGEPDML